MTETTNESPNSPKNSRKTAPSTSTSSGANPTSRRAEKRLDEEIEALLCDPQHANHPLRAALQAIVERQREQLGQLERLTTISDGYQTVLHQRNQSLSERYDKQVRQLQKIVRISDHYQKMLRDLNEKLQITSNQDSLTGLFNRRHMLERLGAEVALSGRRQSPFCVALLDIDHFKSVNDNFGHHSGDLALVSVAQTLTGALRAYDLCARWGGEEFLVLFPETSAHHAGDISNRLRLLIEKIAVPGAPDGVHLSVSAGLAEHQIDTDINETIKRADTALYAAKASGRNRVVVAEN